MSQVKIVILAAGKGKRMGASVPKPLVAIAGKPMVQHLVETVSTLPTQEKPIVVVSPEAQHLFREALGDRVVYATQHEALGTGDAVKASRDLWKEAVGIMVLNADHPFLPKKVLQELMEACIAEPTAVHMLTAVVPSYEGEYQGFKSWGRILRNSEGKVRDIREAKDASNEERLIQEINPAIYIFPAKWLADALDGLTNKNASGEYYLTDVVHIACEQGLNLLTTTTDALSVIGVNTLEELAIAELYKTKK